MPTRTMTEQVTEFHQKHGYSINRAFTADNVMEKRLSFIDEEYREFVEAVAQGHKPHVLKELCDLMYQLTGFAVAYGLPLEDGFARVHASNMTKDPAKGDGKAIKGAGYKPAQLDDLFATPEKAA